MIKFNRLYALAAAGICALAISCTSAPKDAPASAAQEAQAPAAAAALAETTSEKDASAEPAAKIPDTLSEDEKAAVTAAASFLKTMQAGDPSWFQYIDSTLKEKIAEEAITETKLSDEAKEAMKKEIISKLNDPKSDLAKSAAEDFAKDKELFKAIEEILNAEYEIKVEGSKAVITGREKNKLPLVKEADGWKVSHEFFE